MKAMVVLIVLVISASAFAQSFTGIGFVPGAGESRPSTVSSDGTTVVGESGGTAFRWRVGTGMIPLSPMTSVATATSGDGSVVVGGAAPTATAYPAARWAGASETQLIPGMQRWITATNSPVVSSDATVIAGPSSYTGAGAVRWSAETGTVSLPAPPLGSFSSVFMQGPTGINGDGSVIVGLVHVNAGPPVNFPAGYIWRAGIGTDYLRDIAGEVIRGAGPVGLTEDGSIALVVVGSTLNLWTSSTGLSEIPGFNLSQSGAPVIAGNGGVVGWRGLIWTSNQGTRDLPAVLLEAGCDISGWSGLVVTGLSYDGRAMCGYGVNPQGLSEGWHATVPSPWGVVVLAGVLGVGRRRRKPLA